MDPTNEPMLVLVVDDEYGIREMLRDILEDEGYQVATVANGAEALTYLQQAPVLPCVILLDLTMPVMTGWEFRLAQQNDPRIAAIPVVALSARQSIAHATYTVTMDNVLSKPIDLDRLLEVVQGYSLR